MNKDQMLLPLAASAPNRPLGWVAYMVLLVALGILLALGTWQVQRLHLKNALLATIEQRRTSEPQPLDAVERQFANMGDVDYQAARVTGRFLNDREQFFFATWQGQTGFYVYTPLRLDDGRFILINRGFVPYDLKDPAKRPEGEIAEPITLNGLARNPLVERPSMIVPDNDPAKNIFYWKDRDAMARHAGLDLAKLVPFFIDADATPNAGGLPVGGVTMVDLPNSHLQYAVTWYGLAAALIGVFVSFEWRRRQGRRS